MAIIANIPTELPQLTSELIGLAAKLGSTGSDEYHRGQVELICDAELIPGITDYDTKKQVVSDAIRDQERILAESVAPGLPVPSTFTCFGGWVGGRLALLDVRAGEWLDRDSDPQSFYATVEASSEVEAERMVLAKYDPASEDAA